MLTLDRLTKQYENKIAVDRVTLTFGRGVYGLLGANGAGKTTLMRMICGVLKPTSGEIHFNSKTPADAEYRACLGYLPQDFGYYPDFTAVEFLKYISCLKGLSKLEANAKAEVLLEFTALKEVKNKKIKSFSGGMKQRLGIAQSLLNNPKLLILDEPTAGLDPKERVRFRNMLSQLGDDATVLLSTHIVSDLESIANQILVMKNGGFIANGTNDQLIKALQGKVWECVVNEKLSKQILQNCTVVNIRTEKNGIFMRIVSETKPYEHAIACEANLEDIYLYHFNEETLNENFN